MTLDELRVAIDTLDENLVSLLDTRARLALAIGEVKRAHGLPVHQPEREVAVLYHALSVTRALDGPLLESGVVALFERIIDLTREVELETAGVRNGE
jgi:chorismate mutase